MKYLLITIIFLGFVASGSATDPIKRKTYFIEFDLSYPYYHHYNQVLFKRNGLGLGGAASVGHRRVPIYLEYFYQSPLTFKYRNNEVSESYQEIGLRYNLNHLTYLIPYGIDPYLGGGLMFRNSEFKQENLDPTAPEPLLLSHQQKAVTYKLSGGVKVGNRSIVLGLHYDYLPGGLSIPNSELNDLRLYNGMHVFSLRVGFRLNSVPGRRIKCPRFNTKQKRTFAF